MVTADYNILQGDVTDVSLQSEYHKMYVATYMTCMVSQSSGDQCCLMDSQALMKQTVEQQWYK